MFDFDVSKLMIVAIVALAVIPPKDLPRVMRTVGQFVGKMRRMAAEFQGQFMDAMREADLESVKKEFEAIGEQAKINASFDPAAMIRDDVTKAAETRTKVTTSEIALNAPTVPPAAEAPASPAAPTSVIGDDVMKVETLVEVVKAETAPPVPLAPDAHPQSEGPAKQSAAE
jgi:sec-independent protein translocase protein TatB